MKCRPPEKGEHNHDVLGDLGFSVEELKTLKSESII
jgi:crotonobetainyl-CoA:carnitine CoA-transferase CaiB-like acyl-CoA transferase